MAGDWIKMRGNLWDDPRVARIVELTDTSEAAVIGALYWLWSTADQHSEDGRMQGLTGRGIDRKTGVKGFADAVKEVGWLSEGTDGVCIARFEEHNGASAKRRSSEAQRKANGRKLSADDADTERTECGQDSPESGQGAELEKELEKEEEKKEAPTVLVGKQASRPPDCPTQEIVSLYHEHLPMLPRVEVLGDSRKRAISARWRQVVTDPDIRGSPNVRTAGLEWFAWFFGHCAKSRFLTGRAKDWKADLDFLMTPNKFAKAVEGSYHKEVA